MQDAVIILRREIDKAARDLAKAKDERRHAAYVWTLEHKVRTLTRALMWVEYGDREQIKLGRVQTMIDYGSTDNGNMAAGNRPTDGRRKPRVPDSRQKKRG